MISALITGHACKEVVDFVELTMPSEQRVAKMSEERQATGEDLMLEKTS